MTEKELSLERARIIRHLVAPLASVLDDSIGCALWFAGRGQGSAKGFPYVSPSRVRRLRLGRWVLCYLSITSGTHKNTFESILTLNTVLQGIDMIDHIHHQAAELLCTRLCEDKRMVCHSHTLDPSQQFLNPNLSK